jgi:hypothetical protein
MVEILLILSWLGGENLPVSENDDFQVITQNVSESEEEWLDQCDGFELVSENDLNYLRFSSGEWSLTVPDFESHRLLCKEGEAWLIYQQDAFLHLLRTDANGTVLFNGVLLENPLDPVWDVVLEDDLYLCGAITNYVNPEFSNYKTAQGLGGRDAFLAVFNDDLGLKDWGIFGGEKNESFEKISVTGEGIFAVGKKDPLSGGDFGNGGQGPDSNFVCELTRDLEVQDYLILLGSSPIRMFGFREDYLFLGTGQSLYKFAEDLRIVHKRDLGTEILYSQFSELNGILCLENGNGRLCGYYDFQDVFEFPCPQASPTTIFDKYGEVLCLRNETGKVYWDLLDRRSFWVGETYQNTFPEPRIVKSLSGLAQLEKEISEPAFNPLVFGNYAFTFLGKTASGLPFSFQKTVSVLQEANVSEGMIYPLGYQLNFTGLGMLNGKGIVNNYPLSQSGHYVLILTGVGGISREINFQVESDQIPFSESPRKTWDREIECASPFYLDFTLTKEVTDVTGVVINGSVFEDLVYDRINKSVHLRLMAPETAGINDYFIEKIQYLDGSDPFSLPINQIFTLNVLNSAPEVTLGETDTLVFKTAINDPQGTIRCFRVTAVSDTDEAVMQFGLSDHNLVLPGLAKGKDYEVTLSLIYDRGNQIYENLEILSMQVKGGEPLDLGEITITQKAQTLGEFILSLSQGRKNLRQVVSDNQLLYQSQPVDYPKLVLIGIAGAAAAFVVSVQTRKFIRKKRNRIS